MSESIISNQVNKILTRFDQKLSSSPSYAKTLELLKLPGQNDAKKPVQNSNQNPESFKTLTSLQEIYQNSIGRYLKPDFRSKTPEIVEDVKSRSPTPTIPKSPSQLTTSTSNFQPKLNKNSLKIASRLQVSKERLLTNSTPKVFTKDEEFTYHPQINKKSSRMSSKKNEPKARWDTLYYQGQEKKKELNKLREENEAKEKDLLDCSFRPNILKPSLNANPSQTVERLNIWAKNRDCKIKEKKENNVGRDLKECTFMPKIIESSLPNENLYEIKGITPFIERGKKIQNSGHEATTVIHQVTRDIGKKKYNELVDALHNELQSLVI